MIETNLRLTRYPKSLFYQIKTFEKIPIEIFENSNYGSKHVANLIALAIKAKQQKGENIVLGLATGSTPIKVYAELIKMYKKKEISFSNVITFNLDEYFPMNPDQIQSYHHFMHEYLFDHVDIPKENINIPEGNIEMADVYDYCENYEKKIQLLGGIDIQLLGIGRTGHIAFNEPGSSIDSTTRLIRLNNITRRDAADDFMGLENVPYKAITMGIKTVMEAKEIYIMAWGQHKAEIVRRATEEEPNSDIPATYLQQHDNVRFILDTAAASKLTRVEFPWKVGSCNWSDDLVCKAVVWLSQTTNKAILKLTDEDYNEHGLSELLLKTKTSYQLNIDIFNRLQHTITGWPGGKPGTINEKRPERAKPGKKKVLIFSPHPDDDVISMGGTFLRLVDQGHEVHVAYQTSGNIAVHDYDVNRYIEFFEEYYQANTKKDNTFESIKKARSVLRSSSSNKNTPEIRKIKGLIRRGEARAAAQFCGLKESNIHFLDLPFYETGNIRKKGLSSKDVAITVDMIKKIKPHQIFAAGDLADPHGTHRICLDVILDSLNVLKSEKWIDKCWLWLYRGAWQEFAIDEIEMAVPLSPKELLKKRKAIFMHQSQKDSAPYPGEDNREFWQRSEYRNKQTAKEYRELGFAEYEAMEAFKRWIF